MTFTIRRDSHCQHCFVKDSGSIPKAEKFEYYVPCPMLHPGLCATEHGWCYAAVCEATDALFRCVREWKLGAFVRLRFVAAATGFELKNILC